GNLRDAPRDGAQQQPRARAAHRQLYRPADRYPARNRAHTRGHARGATGLVTTRALARCRCHRNGIAPQCDLITLKEPSLSMYIALIAAKLSTPLIRNSDCRS